MVAQRLKLIELLLLALLPPVQSTHGPGVVGKSRFGRVSGAFCAQTSWAMVLAMRMVLRTRAHSALQPRTLLRTSVQQRVQINAVRRYVVPPPEDPKPKGDAPPHVPTGGAGVRRDSVGVRTHTLT